MTPVYIPVSRPQHHSAFILHRQDSAIRLQVVQNIILLLTANWKTSCLCLNPQQDTWALHEHSVFTFQNVIVFYK